MSTCGLCGERLQPGMGHACSRDYGDTRGHSGVVATTVLTAKTWRQLELAAAADRLDLLRTDGCVTVRAGSHELLTITTSNALDDDNADRVVRAALDGALDALRRTAR